MPRAIIADDRIEVGQFNPLIGGSIVDTLTQVRAAVAFIGHGADHAALLDAGSLGASPTACRGQALLCACVDVALRFELAAMAAEDDANK
jgi:hypothetical protein